MLKNILAYIFLGLLGIHNAYASTTAHSTSFSSDGRMLAVGKSSVNPTGAVEVWDWKASTLLYSFPLLGDINKVRFSDNGEYLAASAVYELGDSISGDTVCIWHLPTERQLQCWTYNRDAFTLSDLKLVVSNGSGIIAYTLPDLEPPPYVGVLGDFQIAASEQLAYSLDLDLSADDKLAIAGRTATTSTRTGRFALLQYTNSGLQTVAESADIPFYHVSWSSDGTKLLTGQKDGFVSVWSTTTTGQLLQGLQSGFTGEIHTIYSPDGSRIVVGEQNTGSVKIYNANTYELLHSITNQCSELYTHTARYVGTLVRPESNPQRFALSPDNQNLAYTCGQDYKTIRLDGEPVDQPPQVVILSPANNTTITVGDTLTLSGTALDTEDGDLSVQIDWHSSIDGYLGSGASLSYAPSSGTHTFRAEATDSAGQRGVAQVNVNVEPATSGNQPPEADFTFSISKMKVRFYDASSDSDGTIISYHWSFGDGGSSDSKDPKHQYKDPGNYLVRLKVVDDQGAESIKEKLIYVGN